MSYAMCCLQTKTCMIARIPNAAMKVVSEATLIVNKLRRKRTKQPQTVESLCIAQTAELVDEIRG